MTRSEAVNFLLTQPYKYAHLLGFDKLTELHNDWIIDMVRGEEDETLQAHRGSYKTTCVSVALSLIILLLPSIKTMFMRKTDTDVKEIVNQVIKILEHPVTKYFASAIYDVDLKLPVKNSLEVSTNLCLDIKGTSQLFAMGIGGSLTGKHFDRVFTDDIVNLQDRQSRAERERTKMIYQELQNVRNRGGRIYNTGTPWHKDDAFVLMPNIVRYDCYSTGLISENKLKELQESMVPSLFAANYELRHIAREDVIFLNPQTGADVSNILNGIGHIDAAYGGADSTAYTLINYKNGKYYIYGRLWWKHVDECLDEIIREHHRFLGGKIYCEDNADKGYLKRDISSRGERGVAYHEQMNKHVKIISYLKPVWKDVIFVEGTDPEYIEQICDYCEDAEHDDAPDSAASAIRKIKQKKSA